MSEFSPTVLLSVFGGALLALLGGALGKRYQTKAAGKALSVAFWEELSATSFYKSNIANYPGPAIGGFTSQTFDTLFAEMVRSLPKSLVRDLMRYHLRTRYLCEQQAQGVPLSHHQTFYDEAQAQRADLLTRLQFYETRGVAELVLLPSEISPWEMKPWRLSIGGGR